MSRHVAVLMGGWSAEREVSLVTGRDVCRALKEAGLVCGSPEDQRTCYCVNPDRLAELKRLVGSL